jgi:hypothetical protein
MKKRVNELTSDDARIVCHSHSKCVDCPLNLDGKCYKDIIQAKEECEEEIKRLTGLMNSVSYDENQLISVNETIGGTK